MRDASIELYRAAAELSATRGVILADTKFEFGLDADGALTVGDEVLTPDSSRYWPADGFEVGHGQPSFDKQYVRDWASGTGWDKTPPAPAIPDEVVAGDAREVRRGVREDHRRAVRRLAREDGSVKARVLIRPKAGILDPQGVAVEQALPALGFSGVSEVRVGRMVELEIEDESQLDALCQKLLANTLIEDYEIVSVDAAGTAS